MIGGSYASPVWLWLSFCDSDLPKGQQFLGVAIVGPAHNVGEAASLAWSLGCNPGGEMVSMPIPDAIMAVVAESDRSRLLTRAEAEPIMAALEVAANGQVLSMTTDPTERDREVAMGLADTCDRYDLADMQRAVSQIEEVYMHITGGSLSKWNTDPVYIKQAHDDAVERAEKEERERCADELDGCVTWDDVIRLVSKLRTSTQ